ncbi:rod-binding protein [Azospirillum sp. sgz302134]
MDTALPLSNLASPRIPPLAERAQQKQGLGLDQGWSARTAVRSDIDDSKVDPAKRAQIRKAADDFENVFVSQMLGHMFSGIEVDETFGGGHGEEMFRSMLTDQYAHQVNRRGGFGIADQVYRELLRAQEGSHG